MNMRIEEGYRRGAVLGLTVAEIFILLVFLMLLALLAMNHYWKDISKTDPKIVEVTKGRTSEEVAAAIKIADMLKKQYGSDIDTTQIRIISQVYDEAKSENEENKKRIEELEEENKKLKEEIDQLKDTLRIVGKGINPPCWYQLIEDTNPLAESTVREKPYYLFDIAIREDHMEVQRLEIPAGRAVDDGGKPYIEEAKSLDLESIPYGVPLSDLEMREVMQGLYEKGKGSKVRTYSCIFWVRVWDETHPGSKERWKQAHDRVLEQLFGTHQVQGISWENRDKEPVNIQLKQ